MVAISTSTNSCVSFIGNLYTKIDIPARAFVLRSRTLYIKLSIVLHEASISIKYLGVKMHSLLITLHNFNKVLLILSISSAPKKKASGKNT
ncbi:MAG: hypothetical protein EHM85_18310 [Desulfobacteraceae bacterium]|nr:MAG: hypothetical protein EHM85_18310 [Desulfobacteraceae bacterium]